MPFDPNFQLTFDDLAPVAIAWSAAPAGDVQTYFVTRREGICTRLVSQIWCQVSLGSDLGVECLPMVRRWSRSFRTTLTRDSPEKM